MCKTKKLEERPFNLRTLAILNRQPSLHAHSAPVMRVVPKHDDSYTMSLSPLCIEQLNAGATRF